MQPVTAEADRASRGAVIEPIPHDQITEGFYVTDSDGSVQVRRGPDGELTVWGLSCWSRGAPSTWEYRAYGESLDSIRQRIPDIRWWPSVDLRPEAVAEMHRVHAEAVVGREAANLERDRLRDEIQGVRATLACSIAARNALAERLAAAEAEAAQWRNEAARLGEVMDLARERRSDLPAHIRTLGILAGLTPEQIARLVEGA